ncbi:MAG TPA: helicase C-terminal domain-containing protein, partial [Treponemataceae bacterium]|nr:helicase C-terminal domain-containing protein [Treponemataceae bacterium]
PFAVPNEPVFAARSEAIEKQGRSSFAELSLPGAIIAFRQGFGRLMRRNTDRGIITVLDRRLLAKSYGRLFLASLPETRQLFSPTEDLIFEIKSFLK